MIIFSRARASIRFFRPLEWLRRWSREVFVDSIYLVHQRTGLNLNLDSNNFGKANALKNICFQSTEQSQWLKWFSYFQEIELQIDEDEQKRVGNSHWSFEEIQLQERKKCIESLFAEQQELWFWRLAVLEIHTDFWPDFERFTYYHDLLQKWN